MRASACAVTVGVVFALRCGTAASERDRAADVIPFDLGARGTVTVSATVDGEGPFRFVIDTGANRSAVAEGVARTLHAREVARSEVVTAVGSATAPVVELENVAIGGRTRLTVAAVVLPSEVLARTLPQADGIIGQDVLLDRHYTLDYRRHLLVWTVPDPVAETNRLALSVEEGRVLVDLPQPGGHRDLRIVPDSGASDLVLYRPVDEALGLQPTFTTVGADWLLGHRDVRLMRWPRLCVGVLTLRDQPVLVVDRPRASTGADGVLPLRLFSSASFDARGGSLVLNAP